jgi:glycosyltransferase involved in cell wall biosynthesis
MNAAGNSERGCADELPTVSVVVATHNRAHMIGATLRSIAAQTYPRLETVVVDDGSTDGTEHVVAAIAAEDRLSIVYHRQANAGCAAARNAGVRLSRGELIVFLDSDDQWAPTAAEVLTSTLVRSGADFAYAPSLEVFPSRRWRREIVVPPSAAGRPEAFATEHFLHHEVRQGAFMCKRSVFTSIGGMDETLRHNEDSDFVQRVAIRYRGTYVDTPTVRCFHHDGNKSADRPSIYDALLVSAAQILEEFPEFARSLGENADRRLGALRVLQIEALARAGRIDDARAAAAQVSRLPAAVRISLALGTARPLAVQRWVEQGFGGLALHVRQTLR